MSVTAAPFSHAGVRARRGPRPLRLLRLLGRACAWLVLILALGVLALAVLVPRLAGAVPYTVLTGSMAPALPPGTLVVVRPVPVDRIAVGDVLTFQVRSGEPRVVTHRVVAISYDAAGAPLFTTRGDANDVADAAAVMPVQVRGVVWYHLPWVGRLGPLLSVAERRHLVVGTAVVLLVYAASQVVVAGRGRPRRGAHRG